MVATILLRDHPLMSHHGLRNWPRLGLDARPLEPRPGGRHGAKAHNVDPSHSGGKIARKPGRAVPWGGLSRVCVRNLASFLATLRKKTLNCGSSRAHDQNRIIRMTHDRLGHAAEHPALRAGAAMRAHSDQRIEGFSRRCDNFVCFETLFSCE
jgi:hypothetical protein